jgi:hypothetical protein
VSPVDRLKKEIPFLESIAPVPGGQRAKSGKCDGRLSVKRGDPAAETCARFMVTRFRCKVVAPEHRVLQSGQGICDLCRAGRRCDGYEK